MGWWSTRGACVSERRVAGSEGSLPVARCSGQAVTREESKRQSLMAVQLPGMHREQRRQSGAGLVAVASALVFVIFPAVLIASPGQTDAASKIEFRDGRLTVAAANAPLARILEEVARQTKIEVRGLPLVGEQAWVNFSSLPLEAALPNLLSNFDYAIVKGEFRAQGAPPLIVVIFGKSGMTEREKSKIADAGLAGLENGDVDVETERLATFHASVEAGDVEALRKALVGPDQMIQAEAFDALAKSDPQGTIEALLDSAKSGDPAARLQALQLLSQASVADEQIVASALKQALKDDDGMVKGFAIQALAARGGPEAMGNLSQALGDPDPSVRMAVIESVAQNPEGRGLLQRALSDSDESVRATASYWRQQTAAESR